MNTLHFINRVDNLNCGDKLVTPLLHYYDYFKQYNVKRHDSRYIEFDAIDASDVVIIGGGGMFDYAEYTNRAINKVLDTGAAVIGWSPGFNQHFEFEDIDQTPINFDRFSLLTVRDFENAANIPYLSDVTCKLPQLKNSYPIRRKFGIAQHANYPIDGFDYDSITNDKSIEDILQFIGESEVVLSNSFHMIYWSILMGKKTICINPFSPKFFAYKYKPAYCYDIDNLQTCIQVAKNYNVLEECIGENDAFFEKVKSIIEAKLLPVSHEMTLYDNVTQMAIQHQALRDGQLVEGDAFSSQLFIDTGCGFTEDCKQIVINNVYGDILHKVRFNLSKFNTIKALRFDPIEGKYCKVEIVSANLDGVPVMLSPQLAVRDGDFDCFLTTDPQYYITALTGNHLEIQFRMRIKKTHEAEFTVFQYVNEKVFQVQSMETFIEKQASYIEEQSSYIEEQSSYIEEQSFSIRELEAYIDNIHGSLSWKLTSPLRKISIWFRQILKGNK